MSEGVAWQRSRKLSGNGAIIGGCFGFQPVSRLIAQYVGAVGIAKGGCHLFQRSCATLMLENGADARFIQQLLRHANLNTNRFTPPSASRRNSACMR
jgi:integrase/recombinase XerD